MRESPVLCGMNVAAWMCQGFLAAVFFYSGICKAWLPEARLVRMGQTGVEGLSPGLLAALCLGAVMVLAARVHARRREFPQVAFNLTLLAMCGAVVAIRAS